MRSGSSGAAARASINTSQQVGAAIAVAVGTTLAATATASYVDARPGTSAVSEAALTHGYHVAYYVFAGVTTFAAVLTALMLESRSRQSQVTPAVAEAPEPGTA